jgi:undecaprenyl-diphosphatase
VLEAIVLGLVQGLTEFLPVSSSGHLVIIPYLVAWEPPPLAFDVALHAATLVAVIAYFAGDLWFLATRSFGIGTEDPAAVRRARLTVGLLAAASVPAALAGYFLEPVFEETFGDPRIAAVMLFVTGTLLWGAERIRRRRAAAELGVAVDDMTPREARLDPGRGEGTTSFTDAITIGIAQMLAILPGISRSGATIAAGMTRGLSREGAARFSFLMAVPVIAGAFVFQLGDLTGEGLANSGYGGSALVAGMVAAGLSGYWAIRYLLRLVTTDDLLGFARYVVFFGALTLLGSFTWLGPPSQV